MVATNPFRNRKPILSPEGFFGRQQEIQRICARLTQQPPQCCAVSGLPRIGKTSLLYYLYHLRDPDNPAGTELLGNPQQFVFVYLNAGSYIDPELHTLYGVLLFWRDLYYVLARELGVAIALAPLPVATGDAAALEQLQAMRHKIEELLRGDEDRIIVLLLDNAEGIARLPRICSSMLRALTQDLTFGVQVAIVASSQVPLHDLYNADSWHEPSAFWSLFDESIVLGTLEPSAARELVLRPLPDQPRSMFSVGDLNFALHLAGRHPDILTLTCAILYDWYMSSSSAPDQSQRLVLAQQVYDAALPLCGAIWNSLISVPGAASVLLRLARRQPIADDDQRTLAILERRGVIERDHDEWRLLGAVLRQYLLEQAALPDMILAAPDAHPQAAHRLLLDRLDPPAFTYLEREVYTFLATNAGVVCTRDAIKQAIWPNEPPTDSALQKLIERIRDKIEPDPRHPRRLIAVRGQGYMLRPDPE